MAIGQSNMFSAPGDTQLGGNEQLAGASQPKAPSMGIFDTTAPVGQTMNQMQQSQLSPGLFGGFSERDKQAQLRAASDPSSMFFDPRRSTPPMMPPSGIRNPFTGQIIGRGLGLSSPIMAMDSETPMLGGTPMPPITDEVG